MEKLKITFLKEEKGITLVELLASLALMGLVLTLAMSVYMTGQKQYNSQTTNADVQDSLMIAMKDITKEIRSAKSPIVISGNEVTTETRQCGNIAMKESHPVVSGKKLKTDSHNYEFLNNKLLKDGNVIQENIKSTVFTQIDPFLAEETNATTKKESCPLVIVEIISSENDESLVSEIYIRK